MPTFRGQLVFRLLENRARPGSRATSADKVARRHGTAGEEPATAPLEAAAARPAGALRPWDPTPQTRCPAAARPRNPGAAGRSIAAGRLAASRKPRWPRGGLGARLATLHGFRADLDAGGTNRRPNPSAARASSAHGLPGNCIAQRRPEANSPAGELKAPTWARACSAGASAPSAAARPPKLGAPEPPRSKRHRAGRRPPLREPCGPLPACSLIHVCHREANAGPASVPCLASGPRGASRRPLWGENGSEQASLRVRAAPGRPSHRGGGQLREWRSGNGSPGGDAQSPGTSALRLEARTWTSVPPAPSSAEEPDPEGVRFPGQ